MVISDKERRKFAKSLRYIAQHPPEWATSACAIAEVFDSNYPLWKDSGELFDILADLIDRPTCSIKRGYQTTWGVCSRCGALVNAERAVSTAIEYLPTRYCPWCGKEIENDERQGTP